MKKNGFSFIDLIVCVCVIAILCAFVAPAFAGSVYGRATSTLSTTAGTGSWNSDSDYAARKLVRIWVENVPVTNQVITVKRVTSDGAYTQAVGSVSCGTAKYGNTATFTAGYLADEDDLTFTPSIATGGVVVIEYEQQEH
jgi:Tfp pilus assembly protein FimT